ncbi:GNAT family N-acetyltransferase [Streptomyces sp. Tue 6430]|nr:GNAT family N-acetyltransferase [Streptomyces sp. Tue 6430]
MNDVSWRRGDKRDRQLLESFACCPADHPQRRACDQPWAHEVQTYFRCDAITSCNEHNAVYDQRLLLVLDGTDLVGAAVHALTKADDPAGVRERALVAYAVGVDYQGKSLSDGRRASAAVLDAVFMDIASRHGEGQVVFLHASVHPANEASRTVLSRHGLRHLGTNGDYMPYSARIC